LIHQYINNGYYIVLDVNSGAVHSVDAQMYGVVEYLAGRVPDMEKPEKLTPELREETVRARQGSFRRKRSGTAWMTRRNSSIAENCLRRMYTRDLSWTSSGGKPW
jgi:hypothetical protein